MPEEARSRFIASYSEGKHWSRGRQQAFLDHMEEVGARAMLEYLENTSSYCHPLAHDLGKVVYRFFEDLGRAVHECGSGCSSACMHGAVQEAYGSVSVEEIVASVDTVCDTEGMAEINRPGNCAHALGHALMMASDDSLEVSLASCSEFPTKPLAHYCATGVFMEFGADRSSRITDPLEGEIVSRQPCNEFPAFAAACYRYVVPRMRRELDSGDPEDLKEICRRLPRREQLGCFRGVGTSFSASSRANPNFINDVCADTSEENRLVCIDALVEQASYRHLEESKAICERVGEEARAVCEAALTGRYQLYKPIMDVYLTTDDGG